MTSVTVDGRLVFLVAIDARLHRGGAVHAERVAACNFAVAGRAGHLGMAGVAEEHEVRHAVEALRRRLGKVFRERGRQDPSVARPALIELREAGTFRPHGRAMAVGAGDLALGVDPVAEPLGVQSQGKEKTTSESE